MFFVSNLGNFGIQENAKHVSLQNTNSEPMKFKESSRLLLRIGTEAVFKEKRGTWKSILELTPNPNPPYLDPEFIVPHWADKVDSDIGLSYRPASLQYVVLRAGMTIL